MESQTTDFEGKVIGMSFDISELAPMATIGKQTFAIVSNAQEVLAIMLVFGVAKK